MSQQQAVSAQIMGQSYTLSAPNEEAADLRLAISRVDASMCRIRDAGKIKARDRIAVLAALQIAFDDQQAQNALQNAPQDPAAIAPSARPEATELEPHLPNDLQDNDSRLATLIYKLDQALGRDGHLL
jgi:cell division protein ZapA